MDYIYYGEIEDRIHSFNQKHGFLLMLVFWRDLGIDSARMKELWPLNLDSRDYVNAWTVTRFWLASNSAWQVQRLGYF